MFLGAAAALGRGLANPRSDQALFFEAIERGVDRRQLDRAACFVLDFTGNGDPVRVILYPQDGQEDHDLEVGQQPARHLFILYKEIKRAVKSSGSGQKNKK